jgi:hypothetical protein
MDEMKYANLREQRILSDRMAEDVKAIKESGPAKHVESLLANAERLSVNAPQVAFEQLKKAHGALKSHDGYQAKIVSAALNLAEPAGIVNEADGMRIAQFVAAHTNHESPTAEQSAAIWSKLAKQLEQQGSHQAAFTLALEGATERALAPVAAAAIVDNLTKMQGPDQDKAVAKLVKLAESVRGAPYPAITQACAVVGRTYSNQRLMQIARESKKPGNELGS